MEEQAATFGKLYVPPYLVIEIESTKAEISALEEKLNLLPKTQIHNFTKREGLLSELNQPVMQTQSNLSEMLRNPDYLLLVRQQGDAIAEKLKTFVLNPKEEGKLRVRAYEVYSAMGFPISSSFTALFDDLDNEIKVAALETVVSKNLTIDSKTLKKLIISTPAEVAKAAVRAGNYLAEKGEINPALLAEANGFEGSKDEGWAVRLAAVRSIISLDPPNGLDLLAHFTRVNYHVTIQEIIKYIDKLTLEGRVTNEKQNKATGFLMLLKGNSRVSDNTRIRLDKALTRLANATTEKEETTMDQQNKKPLSLFFSYAHEDKPLRDQLEKHLSDLKRSNQITVWSDGDIVPGEEWEPAIFKNLEEADIILLLISADFMASDYCYGKEMQKAMERHKTGSATINPVLVRDVSYRNAPFSAIEALPVDTTKRTKAVTSWSNLDEAYKNVSEGIRRTIRKLNANPK